MKYRKTTFVLAVTSALCATSATASIKEDCIKIKEMGEAQISNWFLEANKRAEYNEWFFEKGEAIFNKCLRKNSSVNNLLICTEEFEKVSPMKWDPWEGPANPPRLSKMKDAAFLATIYTAFCKR